MHAAFSTDRPAIRVIVAFLAAEFAAAFIYAAAFAAEAGFTFDFFLFILGLSFIVGLEFVLVAGVPLWLILRWRRVQSPSIFAVVGIVPGLTAYLISVAMGMSAPSGRQMTFAENIARPFHIARIAAAMSAGGAGALVFWSLAVRTTFPKFQRSPD